MGRGEKKDGRFYFLRPKKRSQKLGDGTRIGASCLLLFLFLALNRCVHRFFFHIEETAVKGGKYCSVGCFPWQRRDEVSQTEAQHTHTHLCRDRHRLRVLVACSRRGLLRASSMVCCVQAAWFVACRRRGLLLVVVVMSWTKAFWKREGGGGKEAVGGLWFCSRQE